MSTRVAMFVLNPCHSDARVLKEATSLSRVGYEVRIFALGNSSWPEALIDQGSFTIQRLEVRSAYQRSIFFLSGLLRPKAEPPPAPVMDRRPSGLSWRRFLRPLLALAAPFALLVLPFRWAADAFLRWYRLEDPAGLPGEQQDGAAAVRYLRWALHALRRATRELPWAAGSIRSARRGVRSARRAGRSTVLAGRLAVRSTVLAGRLAARAGVRSGRGLVRRARRSGRRAVRTVILRLHALARKQLIVLHRPSVHLEYWKRATTEATAWRPDVVHGHDLNALPAAARVAAALQIPLVYDSHELWRHRNRVGRRAPLGRIGDLWQERRLIARADAVITVAESIGGWLERTYRLSSQRVRIVRNVPWQRDNAPSSDVSLRRDYGLQDKRIFLYTGRITTGRGIEEVLDALPELPEDVVFVMLGYGDAGYLRTVLDRAARRGVGERVVVVPPVASESVAGVAAEADAALVAIRPICLSYRFALPNKLFEAIQAHVPVVATDLPEIARVVRRYDLGELYHPEDGLGLARSLRSVLDDPERYRRGARRAAVSLCWEEEALVLLSIYAELAPLPAGPSTLANAS